MREYITASLKAGLIRPSSSPAGAGFFFVGKKDVSLPLMSSVFAQLQRAKVFTNLDLRNAYHLIHIKEGDEWKTGFNMPSGH